MAKRGVEGAYPLATPVGGMFTPDNERRFRILSAAQEAETLARLFVLEQKAGITGGPVDPDEGPYLPLRGGTMTGQIVLPGTPASSLGAAPRGYVDTADAALQTGINARVPLAGGTMTGFLLLSAAPTALLHAATKGYVDAADTSIRTDFAAADAVLQAGVNARLPLAGGTMTGLLVARIAAAASASLRIPHGVDPTAPVDGDIWTTAAGMFAQINGVTVNLADLGSGAAPFATTQEALEGVRADVVMSPALVQARRGAQISPSLSGIANFVFTDVPNEASEIDLLLNGVGFVANQAVAFYFQGAPAARVFSARNTLGATHTPTTGDDNGTVFVIDFGTTAQSVAGLVRLVRSVRGGFWAIEGGTRRSTAVLTVLAGVFNLNGEQNAALTLFSGANFTGGSATARWRI